MEIRQQEKKPRKRGRFIGILLLACIALVVGLWQYHRLIVEVSDGVATDIYQDVLHPFRPKGDISGKPLRVALIQSEYTASSFGSKRDGYYQLLEVWERLMEHEGFGCHRLESVPEGEDIMQYNLLVLPSASCLDDKQISAVKEFLKAGKGVVMTWASGTRNEYGQWREYSLLQEVGGMDVVGDPPAASRDISVAMLAGGYPITSSLASGFHLDVMRYNTPISCHARESRVTIDGVWMDKNDASFGLHSVRDRVAVTHGEYLGGRFVWMGFSVGSCHETAVQRGAFFGLVKNSMLWAGHQVQAFKPVWPDERSCVVAITQNIYSPEDVDTRLLMLSRKHRVPLTSFVIPEVVKSHPELVKELLGCGEVGILGDPKVNYRGLSVDEQKDLFGKYADDLQKVTGSAPLGFRTSSKRGVSDNTLDALVRAGFEYISTGDYDRLVPKAVRSYRKVAMLTGPRLLWQMPEMDYISLKKSGGRNSMLAHFAQINALNGLYCLSFRPSELDSGFVGRLEELLARAKRNRALLTTAHGVIEEWGDWDQIKMSTRHMSATRTSLKISNTGRKTVKDVVMYIELPRITSSLDIESMTLGTELPSSVSHDGIRWKLYLDKLSGGKNVTYYLDLPQNEQLKASASKSERATAD